MSEHTCSRFLTGARLNFLGDERSDAAEPGLAVLRCVCGDNELAMLFSRAFGNDDDAEVFAEFLALLDFLADTVVRERNFRDKNHICAAGYPGEDCYPARVASHDFEYHDTVVAFGSRMQSVNCIGRTGD